MSPSKSDWIRHFELQAKSDRSVKSYCKKNGLRPSRWYYWRSRLSSAASDFLPVVIKDVDKRQPLTVSLVFDSGSKLIIEGFDGTRELSRLVHALQRDVA